MRGLFDYDGPIMNVLGKLADLVILNVLTLIFCIPIVTIGASLTACHYVALKLRRGEGYVLRHFWNSFKENFVQSTVIWLLFAVNVFFCVFIVFVMPDTNNITTCVRIILSVAVIFWVFTGLWVFPMQSKFINKIGTTMKNAFDYALKYWLRTILMGVIKLIPIVLLFVLKFQWYSLLLLFGISIPTYFCAMLYDKIFQQIENLFFEKEIIEDIN